MNARRRRHCARLDRGADCEPADPTRSTSLGRLAQLIVAWASAAPLGERCTTAAPLPLPSWCQKSTNRLHPRSGMWNWITIQNLSPRTSNLTHAAPPPLTPNATWPLVGSRRWRHHGAPLTCGFPSVSHDGFNAFVSQSAAFPKKVRRTTARLWADIDTHERSRAPASRSLMDLADVPCAQGDSNC